MKKLFAKNLLRKTICLLVVVVMAAGLCVAYAATPEVSGTASTTTYYNFYLSMPSHGVTDLATPRLKEHPAPAATYSLTTVTNQSGQPCYINVRNSAGTAIVGNAYKIYSGQTGPMSFPVSYLSGYGNVGTYYRPSGQTSSSSPYGAYVQGSWRP